MIDQKRRTATYFIMLLIATIPLFISGISNHGLWSADEPRVAEIGREMALTGNWAVPTLNQKPFLEEPPLHYAALALTFKAFGISDKVARIPSAFFAFATVLVVFFMANFFYGPKVALLSGIILTTTSEYFRVAHWVLVDNVLTFFIVSAMALFVSGYFTKNSKTKFFSYMLVYIACTLAFYTKGFIGIVIPGLGVLAFLTIDKNLKEIIKMKVWLGVLIFLAMTLPWFIALWQQAGTEYLKVFFLHNHLQRFFPGSFAGTLSDAASGHHHPFYYYLIEFPNGFLPWSILLIPVLFHVFSKAGKSSVTNVLSEKGTLFAKCWFFAGIIFLSIASTKRTLYLVPIFAPMAMLTASYIESTLTVQSINRIGKVFTYLFNIVVLVAGISLIPAYFYYKKLYFVDSGPGLFTSTLSVSVVMMLLSLLAIRYLWKSHLKGYWISMNLSVVAALLFVALIAMPVIDNMKSFVPFCRMVSSTVPTGETLYTYNADETFRGAIPFYTGRYLTEIGIDDEHLQKQVPFFIMIRDRKKERETELTSTGRLFPLARQEMGTDRMLVLFSNTPVQKEITMETLYGRSGPAGQQNRKSASLAGGAMRSY